MDDLVGFRLSPTEDEMVGCLLYCKLMGIALLANEYINETNIYNYDPWMLRFQSKLKLRDFVWYFFTLVENNPANGIGQKRQTSSGFWKLSGDPKPVYDRWGLWSGTRGPIGHKRVLSFHFGSTRNVGKADWVMHEFHNTMLPPNLRTHMMCRVEYKGDDISFLNDNPTEISPALVPLLMNSTASVVTHPVQENWGSISANQNQHLNTQEQLPSLVSNDYEMQMGLDGLLGEESMVDESMVCRGSEYDSTNQNQQEQLPSLASNDKEMQMGLDGVLGEESMVDESMVCRGSEYDSTNQNQQEQLPSLASNDYETQMLFNTTTEDFYSMWNESMVLGNSSSFAETKFYLNELCFDSPPDSPLFTYQAPPR